MTETFKCLNCGKICLVHSRHWQKKYCSKECGDKYYVKNNPNIRKKILRRYADTHREEQKKRSKAYYEQNRERMITYGKEHQLENSARTRAKLIAKKNMEKVCVECHSNGNIHVHHIDFNAFNNNLDNLIYLCSICHGKRHQKN
jgi:hypothetical protein